MPYIRPCTRRRANTLTLTTQTHSFMLWFPDADDVPALHRLGDASTLAFVLLDLPVEHDALVLLDESSQVTAVLLDPPADVVLGIGSAFGAGLEVPFTRTMAITIRDHFVVDAPTTDDIYCYNILRRAHMMQGIEFIDSLIVNADQVTSVAMAHDPDAVWTLPAVEPM